MISHILCALPDVLIVRLSCLILIIYLDEVLGCCGFEILYVHILVGASVAAASLSAACFLDVQELCLAMPSSRILFVNIYSVGSGAVF